MKNLWKFLVLGILIVATAHVAQATPTATGNYSDSRLSPTTSPPAAVGYDMLLAENVPGSVTQSPPYPATIPATSWTTDLHMGVGDTYHGITNSEVDKNALWGASGPTGTYAAGTAGTGKHSENTKSDISTYFSSGPIVYQYIFHVKTYESYNGNVINTDIAMSYQSYQMP